MAEPFASGDWHVTSGKEEEFIARWTEFLQWTRKTQPSLTSASLLRDAEDPNHFLSFAEWDDAAARGSWKQSDGFMQHFSACRDLCDDMRGTDCDRVVAI
ncbi:MAG TPA: antibiotic biosynthesis monooxygenase family protein [Actinomycetota bacterium]